MANQLFGGAGSLLRRERGTNSHPVPRKAAREGGQSLVELAFVIPIFLVVIMATVDFGFALHNYITLTNAAREGARYGVVMETFESGEVEDEARQRLRGDLRANAAITAACKDDDGNAAADCPAKTEVSVLIQYDYKYITPLGPLIHFVSGGTFPTEVTLSSETTMRRE